MDKAGSSGGEPEVKTVNIFLGFFFVVNFCLGTGFLGVPYAFFYSGYLAAIPTLLLISMVSWVNANYLLEVMARAQVSLRDFMANAVRQSAAVYSDTFPLWFWTAESAIKTYFAAVTLVLTTSYCSSLPQVVALAIVPVYTITFTTLQSVYKVTAICCRLQ
jgi:hypothetical protein